MPQTKQVRLWVSDGEFFSEKKNPDEFRVCVGWCELVSPSPKGMSLFVWVELLLFTKKLDWVLLSGCPIQPSERLNYQHQLSYKYLVWFFTFLIISFFWTRMTNLLQTGWFLSFLLLPTKSMEEGYALLGKSKREESECWLVMMLQLWDLYREWTRNGVDHLIQRYLIS